MKIYGYQVNRSNYKHQAYLYFIGKNDKLHRIEIVVPAVLSQADRYINSLFGGGILYKFNNYSEAEDHYADTLERIRNMQSPFDSEIEMDKYYNDRKKKEIITNEIRNSNINKKFMEDAIDEMYNEQDDPFTGF